MSGGDGGNSITTGGAGGSFGANGTAGGTPAPGSGGGGGGGGGADGGVGGAGAIAGDGTNGGGNGGNGGLDGTRTGAAGANTAAATGSDGTAGTAAFATSEFGGGGGGGGGGGAGGYGLDITSSDLAAGAFVNSATVTAGNGGNGGDAVDYSYGQLYANGGDGGDGGIGLNFEVAANAVNSAAVKGGSGGEGGMSGGYSRENGGTGGAGGAAVSLVAGSTFDNAASGAVTGGAGNRGGEAMSPAISGAGGAGVATSQSEIVNDGTITGGNGGASSVYVQGIRAFYGPGGTGGAGISGSNLTIINDGKIAGGVSGDATPIQGDAITLTGGANTLALGTDASFTGAIDVRGSSTTLTFSQGAGTSLPPDAMLSAALAGAGSVFKAGSGKLTLNATSTLSGGFEVDGGTLDLGARSAAGTGIITLAGSVANPTSLMLEAAAQPADNGLFSNTITGLGNANTLDLKGFTFNPADVQDTLSGYILTVTNGTLTERFSLSNPVANYTSQDDGTGGTLITGTGPIVCYAAGTRIQTVRGDVAVEDLAVGDEVFTSDGARRPIVWLGHRSVDCRNPAVRRQASPIRIVAQAFGPDKPVRDLDVSPGHAICVDVLGEVLIPASLLVNGSTIRQVEVDEVTYWHVELDSHDVILAENLPAESYLANRNRGFFREADVVDLAAGPDAAPTERTHADFCRPYVDSGHILDAVRARLAARAADMMIGAERSAA